MRGALARGGVLVGEPVIQLLLDRREWFPGEWVTGRLVITLRRPVYFDAVEAQLFGHELVTVIEEYDTGKRSRRVRYNESVPFLDAPLSLALVGGEPLDFGALDAGEHTYQFAAHLPPDVPPSFRRDGGDLKVEVAYAVRAGLSVPWRFDPKAVAGIDVVVPPRAAAPGPLYATKPPAFLMAATTVDALLHEAAVPRGGSLSGEFTVTTKGTRRMRAITVKIYERAHGNAKGHGASSSRFLNQLKFPDVPFDRPVPFTFSVPKDAIPDYEGELCTIVHTVAAEVDLEFAVNPTLEIPFLVS
ncbi:MAG TPA: hypothetical protein VJ547_11750 [Candidatus Thermoplasmatota archaeon]|nr:hypothetical protein [Candidatus Thermoplasmatota archaeon]